MEKPREDEHDRKLEPGDAERRFRMLVEQIPMVVTYMDVVHAHDALHSTPVYISPQVEDLLGYPRTAWLDESEIWLQVLHPDDAAGMREADAHARRTLGTLSAEYRMIARDGRVVWVSEKASVVTDEVTGIAYWQGVMVDITERKHAEQALAVSERRFTTIFEAAAIGVLSLGADGRVLEANHTLETITGHVPGYLEGVALDELIGPEDDAVLELFDQLITGMRDEAEVEHRLRRQDGSLMWCRTVMTLVRDRSRDAAHVIGMLEDIGERKRTEADLVHRALHDGLTGLPNRQYFFDRLRRALAPRERPVAAIGSAVIFIDVDDFKRVNDSLGHEIGDQVLIALAGRLASTVRPGDTVARFAGDEFIVLAEDVVSLAQATQLGRRLGRSIAAPFQVDARSLDMTVSIGVAVALHGETLSEQIVGRADAAMYDAKRSGRNRVALSAAPQRAKPDAA